LHKEKRFDLYSSPNIVRAVKSRRLQQAGHAIKMRNLLVNAHLKDQEDEWGIN